MLRISTNVRLLLATSAIAQIGIWASPVMAQEAGNPGPSDSNAEVAEIIVTANKREQSINDVGLAITALSGEALQKEHLVSLADVVSTVPGLSFTPSVTQTPVFTLRGVGFYESSLAAYPTTSVYVDQVPLPFPALSRHAAFDLERVEILKGPQGTLFGQNSTGGAINFIAAKPTRAFSTGGDLSFGRFDRMDLNGFVSGPLTETLSARFSVTAAHGDDWQHSYTRSESLGEVNYAAARAIFDWKPTDALDLELNLNGWRDRSDPQAPQYQTLLSQIPAITLQALRDFPLAPHRIAAADWTPTTRPRSDTRQYQGSLRASLEVTDSLTVTSISSYVDYDTEQTLELDGTTLANDDFSLDLGRVKSFSQELRVANSDQSTVRWVAGTNFERSRVNQYQNQDFKDISSAQEFGYTGDYVYSNQLMRNSAMFANLEYDATSRLVLKGGARYTWARRSSSQCTGDRGDNTFGTVFDELVFAIQQGFIPLPGFTPTGIVIPPIGQGCVALDNVTSDGTPVTYLPGEFHGKINENSLSWRIGTDFKFDESTLAYLNIAKGYKAGSFPIASAATFEQYAGVTQESLLSYEAGLKAQVLDRRVSIDGSVFYYDYKDKQLRSKYQDPIFGVLDSLQNIPKSKLYGAELGLSARPLEGLALSFAGSVIKSEITEFTGLSSSGITTNFAGAVVPYTPKYQLRFSADYDWVVGDVSPFVGLTVSARSHAVANIGGSTGLTAPPDFRSSVPLEDIYRLPAYTVVDVRIGANFGDEDRWSLAVFGKNIFNKYYVTNIFTPIDTVARFVGAPSTWGITVSFKK